MCLIVLGMDPNATLAAIREEVAMLTGKGPTLLTPEQYEEWALNLAEHVEALDKWITGGGFLPSDWKEEPAPHAYNQNEEGKEDEEGCLVCTECGDHAAAIWHEL